MGPRPRQGREGDRGGFEVQWSSRAAGHLGLIREEMGLEGKGGGG